MITLDEKVEQDINAICYYYNRQEELEKIYKHTTSLYTKIAELSKQIKKIKANLEIEMHGEYKDVLQYDMKDNHPESKVVHKKVRKGKLEPVLRYITEKDEMSAINKYLKNKGITIPRSNEIDIDELLGLKADDGGISCG